MRYAAVVAALLAGCGAWPAGEVCNQRYRIQFAGIISSFEAPSCEGHDYDDDGYPAVFDRDDRINRYSPDSNIDGSFVGDIADCRVSDPYDPPFYYEEQVYSWDCVQEYWLDQLANLCAAWATGDGEPFEYDEAADYAAYCP